MPRRLIPFMPELHYHIYNRGNNREAIFFEPDNYLYFLKKIRGNCSAISKNDVIARRSSPKQSPVLRAFQLKMGLPLRYASGTCATPPKNKNGGSHIVPMLLRE